MSDFPRALVSARIAQAEVYDLSARLDNAIAARNRAVSAAWRARPGGLCWGGFVGDLNEGLGEGARLSYAGWRNAEREGRGA